MASLGSRIDPIDMSLRLWSDEARLDDPVRRFALPVRHLHRRDEPVGAGRRIADRHDASLDEDQGTDAATAEAWIERVARAITPIDDPAQDLRPGRIVGMLWIAILGRERTPTPDVSATRVEVVSDLGARIFVENDSTWGGDGSAPPRTWLQTATDTFARDGA